MTEEPTEGTIKMEGLYPVCRCGGELKQVKYLDYEDIRVVFHADSGCIIGVMPADY